MIRRGDVYWCDFDEATGHGPAKRRPAVVVSGESFVTSALPTVIVIACTSNLNAARYPGNVFISVGTAGLPKDCVAKVTEVATVDRYQLVEFLGHLPRDVMVEIDHGLKLSLGF